jgi:hypothetical protein
MATENLDEAIARLWRSRWSTAEIAVILKLRECDVERVVTRLLDERAANKQGRP